VATIAAAAASAYDIESPSRLAFGVELAAHDRHVVGRGFVNTRLAPSSSSKCNDVFGDWHEPGRLACKFW
jgi:hypothetical protein